MPIAESFGTLPGQALVEQGVVDLRAGRRTVPALVVQIAKGRLGRAGLLRPDETEPVADAESQLYHLLREEGGDAYSRYNALLRELASFNNALDHRRSLNSEVGNRNAERQTAKS